MSKKIFIKIDTGGCFGSCKSYDIIIFDNGTGIYQTFDSNQTFILSTMDFENIGYSIINSNFLELNKEYVEPTYDLQRKTIDIYIDNYHKTVKFSVGYSQVPKNLQYFIQNIENIIFKYVKK